MKKWLLIGLSVLVVGFVGYQWFSTRTASPTEAAAVRTTTVQKGSLKVKISGSGTVQPVISEDIKSIITNNEIDEVLVAAGEEVKKGDELITFIDGSDPVIAPADGMITTLSVSAGERVTSGQVVAHLTNYKDLQTVVQVDELDIAKIKNDQPVNLKVNAYPEQSYTGKVTAVANEGVSSNGVSTFDVSIHLDKPDNLKVGMSLEASILTASKENALLLPLDAIHSNNGEKYVLVIPSSTGNQTTATEQKIVKTGLANEDYVEITEGVTVGDVIQLPQLATGTTTTSNTRGFMQGGGFGGGGMGGYSRNGGNRQGQSSGRTGN